jgi:hypothetical protein
MCCREKGFLYSSKLRKYYAESVRIKGVEGRDKGEMSKAEISAEAKLYIFNNKKG